MKLGKLSLVVVLVLLANPGCGRGDPSRGSGKLVIRVGHFPNITHAQALVAHQLSRQAARGERARGWFEERLGEGVEIQWYTYNAGPTAMEAIFTRNLDLTYVGPNPALNAFARSGGEEIRVVAGSAVGGAALVVQGDGRIKAPEDFRGRNVATPQLGNTQDVACRAWLKLHGYRVTQQGGDVKVIPTLNPDQLPLFQKGDLDAAWTVEPWVSTLELKGGGKVYLEEGDALTTILVSSVRFLKEHPDVVAKFVRAHEDLTAWIVANSEEAKGLARRELKEETMQEMEAELLDRAWARLRFTAEVDRAVFQKSVEEAQSVGFLQAISDISRLVEPIR